MTPFRLKLVLMSAIAQVAVASMAHAQREPSNLVLAANEFSAPPTALSGGGDGPRNTLEWDSKKARWGLRLGVQQHTDRSPDWRDYQPGLYYKITPRLHIGGAVSLAPEQFDTSRPGDPQAPPPRVRLETTFKF